MNGTGGEGGKHVNKEMGKNEGVFVGWGVDKYTLAKQTNKMGDSNNKEKRTVLIVFFPKMEKVIISIVCDYFSAIF